MRGVSVDCTNPLGRPSPLRLGRLGVDSVRLEARHLSSFYGYYDRLTAEGIQVALLIGPDTEDAQTILSSVNPSLIIVGNEPDGPPDSSSWVMPPSQYEDLWGTIAWLAPEGVPLCTAGMFYGPEYLEQCSLLPAPSYYNKHYPSSQDDLAAFADLGPLVIGEWCYRTGSQQQVIEWQHTLSNYAEHTFYFCWSDSMAYRMGLMDKRDKQKLGAYYHYKAALELA